MVTESKFLGVSIRGWIAVLIVGATCYLAVRQFVIDETLKNLVMLVVGFYYGQARNNDVSKR